MAQTASAQVVLCASCEARDAAAGCAASWCDRCFHLNPTALTRAPHDAFCQVACTAHAALAAVPAPLAVPQFSPAAVASALLVGGAGAPSAFPAICFGDKYLAGLRGAQPQCPEPATVSIDGATYVVLSGEEQDKRRLKRHGLPSVVCSLHARPCLVRVHGLGEGKTAPFALACEACSWDHAQALAWVDSEQQVVPAEVISMCKAAGACGDEPSDGPRAGELCRHETVVAHWLRRVADGRPLSDAGFRRASVGVSVCGLFWIGECGGCTVVSHAGGAAGPDLHPVVVYTLRESAVHACTCSRSGSSGVGCAHVRALRPPGELAPAPATAGGGAAYVPDLKVFQEGARGEAGSRRQRYNPGERISFLPLVFPYAHAGALEAWARGGAVPAPGGQQNGWLLHAVSSSRARGAAPAGSVCGTRVPWWHVRRGGGAWGPARPAHVVRGVWPHPAVLVCDGTALGQGTAKFGLAEKAAPSKGAELAAPAVRAAVQAWHRTDKICSRSGKICSCLRAVRGAVRL